MTSVITESELREAWQNGRGAIPAFPRDTRFSAAALDFIRAHNLVIRYTDVPLATQPATSGAAEWDRPGSFPVVLTGPVPVCSECGQPMHHKPDHMTQIDAGHFAPKSSPRLIFRGRVDSLHALVMLAAEISRRCDLFELAHQLDTLAAYCREIMSAEYHQRPVGSLSLLGKSEEELHDISHWPEKHLGIAHIVPGRHDHEILHWLNVLRTQSREVEVLALQAFPPGSASGSDLSRALNRFSSGVYVLELYFKSGKISWLAHE